MIDHGFHDRAGRRVTLREVGDENWRAVADIAPLDEQRRFVPALAARYLLLSMREGVWNSLAVHADDEVVGHVMWGLDDDGSHWLGGMVIAGAEQGKGVGRAVVRTMTAWLTTQEGSRTIRLSYHPDNTAAGRLYDSLGFVRTELVEDDEIVAELILPGRRSQTAQRTSRTLDQTAAESWPYISTRRPVRPLCQDRALTQSAARACSPAAHPRPITTSLAQGQGQGQGQQNQTTRRTFSAPCTSLRVRMTFQTRPQSVSAPAAEARLRVPEASVSCQSVVASSAQFSQVVPYTSWGPP